MKNKRIKFIEYCLKYRLSYSKIGKFLGVSKTQVHNIIKKDIKIIKQCKICPKQAVTDYCAECRTQIKKLST